MTFWNLAGLVTKSTDKWEYVKKFEIIVLAETWITKEKGDRIVNNLKGYKTFMVEARKERVKGRAKGGMVIGIKLNKEETATLVRKEAEV